jgi:hypothetical protein
MGMLLQDPSVAGLYEDYPFSLDEDFLSGMGSSKLMVRDGDTHDMPLYKGLDWATADLSFDALNKNNDFIDNPQFHQVNTFAVAARAVASVEASTGREMKWKHGGPLVLRPHAFNEANAYYDPSAPSLNFGSFNSPFRRAPIWTCLSHDVVTHELGHAILDSYRPLFLYSEEIDTGALHESIGDLMALFTALGHQPVVERLFRESGGDMMNPNLASGLAEEFGIGLSGIGFPFLRSALQGVNYDEAPTEVHDRSTVWTAAMYEILAKLVAETTAPADKVVLEQAPVTQKGVLQSPMRQMTIQQQDPSFEAYYAQADNRGSFDAFYDAITQASARVQGMMLRALQDVPPTGVTFPTLARVLYAADARLFPHDDHPRELAKAIFERRMMWNDKIKLDAPGIGAGFEELVNAGSAALAKAVFENAEALRIPLAEGAQILTPRLSTTVRRIDAGSEQRGAGVKYVREHYLYYTYELLRESCFFTETGEMAFGMVSIFKGGTLIMDENWQDIQLATDPEFIPEEAGEGESAGESPAALAVRKATRRFTKIYHESLRAFRDGLVRPDGTLPSGQAALPFTVTRQPNGAARLIRQRCNLGDHLQGMTGRHSRFPFDLKR